MAKPAKLIFLKIIAGDFSQGFEVSLQIGQEGKPFHSSQNYRLPKPSEDIPGLYQTYRSLYSDLCKLPDFIKERGKTGRKISHTPANFDQIKQEFQLAYDNLKQEVRNWLNPIKHQDKYFLKLRDQLIQCLGNNQEEVRFFLQTENDLLNKLPWHQWDVFQEAKAQIEFALSPPNFELVLGQNQPVNPPQFNILVILGDSTGINVEEDRRFFEDEVDAKIRFLPEPNRQNVVEALGSRSWDILCFLGHSSSENNQGKIYINSTGEYLTIEDLNPILKNIINKGLKLAIFSSCDGLKIANDLGKLNIPQIIVMREPVPDQVAQHFLKYFLQTFSQGESLYLSVRQARKMLESGELEKELPGSAWLPIICQNPAEPSLVWPLKKFPFPDRFDNWVCDQKIPGHSDIIKSISIHPHGQIFATASLDHTIKIWSLYTGELLETLTAHTGAVTCVTFSQDGQTLASSSASPDGTIKLWETQTWQVKATLTSDDWIVRSIWSVALSPDGTMLVSGHHSDSTVRVWNLNTGNMERILRGHVWAVNQVAYSPNGQMIASGSFDSNIKLWNPYTGRQIYNLNGPSDDPISWTRAFFSDHIVYGIAFSPDGKTLASGGVKQPIQLWGLSDGKVKMQLTGHANDVHTVVFSFDGTLLASGSADPTIRIWDLFTGESLQTLGHADTVYTLAFSPDGQTLVSGGKDRMIKIWRLSS